MPSIDSHNLTKPPLVLIVDDIPENIQIIGGSLKSEGYDLVFATSGTEALAIAKEELPDLVLLDVLMPDINGFTVCEHLKKDPATAEIPVIFITAFVETEAVLKGFKAGGVDYVAKPFKSAELQARTRTHLDLRRSRRELEKISEERKELLHIVCHDLVVTLGGIEGLTEPAMFSSIKDPEELRRIINTAAKNGLSVVELIRNMRSIEERKFELGFLPLADALRKSLQLVDQMMKHKNISVEMNVDAELEVLAESVSLVNSVFNNVLTNAIKFSYPETRILIDAQMAEREVVVSVRDFGIGIPEKVVDRLFDLGARNTREGTFGEQGTGFGMPLVRKFMTLYGGSIEVVSRDKDESLAGHGTLVLLRFKTRRPTAAT